MAGFSTTNFDLSSNLSGDQRAGLDERTLTAIRRVMERENVGFDEARLIHLNSVFRKNGMVIPSISNHFPQHISDPMLCSVGVDANGFPIGVSASA